METKSIKELILDNKIDEALKQLKQFWEEHESLPNECAMLIAELKRQTNERIAGTQSIEDTHTLENRLRWSLLEKIGFFEGQYKTFFAPKKHFDSSTEGFTARIMDKFNNIYLDIKEISNSDTAIIYTATERSSNRTIVIKALKSYDFVADLTTKDEIKIMNKLKHRNVIEVSYSHTNSYPICIILEHINGIDLKKIVHSSGKRTYSETREIILKLLNSLLYLHEKAIYPRNFDPDNILMDTEGEPAFSLPFRILKPNQESRTLKQIKNDIAYMSNAQIAKNSFEGCARCNVYSLGLLTYFLLTGEDLFSGNSLPALLTDRHDFFNNPKYQKEKLKKLQRPDVPQSFIKILVKILSDKFNWNARQLIDLIQECPSSESETQFLVKESYNRAFFLNDNFLTDFYTAFLETSEQAKQSFSEASTLKKEPINIQKQAKMLHYAINLIVETTEKNNFLDALFQNTWHKALSVKEFETFFFVLKEAVKQSDRLWNEVIEKSWDEVIQVNLKAIEKHC